MNNTTMEPQRLIEMDARDAVRCREREATPPLISGVIEALPVALLVVGAGGRIILDNETAGFMLAYHRPDLTGRPVEALLPEYQSAVTATNREKHGSFETGATRRP